VYGLSAGWASAKRQTASATPPASSATCAQVVRREVRAAGRRGAGAPPAEARLSIEIAVIAYFSPIARRSSVVTRVASAMMNAISLLVVMKRAPFLMYST